VFPAVGWRSGWTTALASLELRPPLQSMAGGGRQAHTRHARQAPVGFSPLQRMRSRRSTNPGFPRPGSFPSQRFSRSQGVTPSKTLAGLFHPADAHGVPSKNRPQTGGPRRIRVLEALERRRSEDPSNPALPCRNTPGGARTDGAMELPADASRSLVSRQGGSNPPPGTTTFDGSNLKRSKLS
jgi:hypothetical protein